MACLLAMAVCAGCIDATTIVNVNKDGSGVIIEAVYFGKGFQQMMGQMAAQMGGQPGQPAVAGGADKPFKPPLKIEEYKSKAAKMGEGVKFLSAKEVKKEDGSPGVQVFYSFTDVTKLKIASSPDVGSGQAGPGMGMAPDEPKDKQDSISFSMPKGGKPKLVIVMPKQEPAKPKTEATPKAEEAAAAAPKAQNAEQMAMVKQMFNGFRFRLVVGVDGKITKSNATYVEKDAGGRDHIVTLLDMNIGQLLNDDAMAKKLEALGDISDMTAAKEKLKGIEGLKIETAEKVEIEFE